MKRISVHAVALALFLSLGSIISTCFAQGTAFTYQGQLNSGGGVVSGSYDLQFTLYTTNTNGVPIEGPLTNSATAVSNGLFTTTIDFGAGAFTGGSNWLDIAVRTNGVGNFMELTPRQPITPTPYAIYAANAATALVAASAASATTAATADNFSGNIADSQLSANIARLNGTNLFTGTNTFAGVTLGALTLNGALILPAIATGSSNVIYSGGTPLLYADNNKNFFSGPNAGNLTTSGSWNTANGNEALSAITSGIFNTADGSASLFQNASGNNNTANGNGALFANTTGSGNTASGRNTMLGNISGNNNTAVGFQALSSVTNGSNNIALGFNAGSGFTGNESSNILVGNAGNPGDQNTIRIGTPGIQTNTFIVGVIIGNGSGMTNLNASQLAGGVISTSILPGFQGSDNAIGGGVGNTIVGSQSAILGGQNNTNDANQSSIGGGSGNNIQTGAYYAFIGGGGGNLIQTNAYDSVIGSGYHNTIQSNAIVSFIGGGQYNYISNNAGFSVLGGGYDNTNTGSYSVIPGGEYNVAASNSFAAGSYAQATNTGSFVWSDNSSTSPFASTNNNSFNVRAAGGVSFVTGGAWMTVNGAAVLSGVVTSGEINDGGSSAYQGFQQLIEANNGNASVAFSEMASFPAALSPAFSLTINGSAFGTVMGFSGSEGISQPYSYLVEVQTSGSAVNPNSEIGLNGSLTFSRNGRSTTFAGLVTACSLSGSNSTGVIYMVKIESPLAYLALKTDYRLFTTVTAPTEAASVYQAITGYTPATSLAASYSVHQSLTQYGETSLNFFRRLLENEGVFYFFNQGSSPPSLVLGDSAAAYLAAPNSPFTYYGNLNTNVPAGAEYIQTFQKASHQSTWTNTVNSYNPVTAAASLLASTNGTEGVGEYYEFGNDVQSLVYDQQLAQVRQDLQATERMMITGSGTAPDLRAGYTFTLTDQSSAGLGGSYLVTSVQHAGFVRVTNGVSTYFYGNQFTAIPTDLNFRPAQVTPKPQAQPCTAVVTGPAGQTIYTDQYGRVKVQFKWDRYGTLDQNSSAWIRVAMPMAGSNWGMMFSPHIGDEVLVSFVQGDPDQPVVTGSLYNAINGVLFPLPGDEWYSYIAPAGTSGNMIRFNDKAGSQQLLIQSSKDMATTVAGNFTQTVSGNATIQVNGTLSLSGSTGIKLGSSGTAFTNLESGQAILPSPGIGAGIVETNLTITFPQAFSVAPKIILTIANDPNFQGVSDVYDACVSSNSTTAFRVNVYRVDANDGWSQNLRINWQAWQ